MIYIVISYGEIISELVPAIFPNCMNILASTRAYICKHYMFGFDGIYCLNEQIPRSPSNFTSTVTHVSND